MLTHRGWMDVFLNTPTVYGKRPTATTVFTYRAQNWTIALQLVQSGIATMLEIVVILDSTSKK